MPTLKRRSSVGHGVNTTGASLGLGSESIVQLFFLFVFFVHAIFKARVVQPRTSRACKKYLFPLVEVENGYEYELSRHRHAPASSLKKTIGHNFVEKSPQVDSLSDVTQS